MQTIHRAQNQLLPRGSYSFHQNSMGKKETFIRKTGEPGVEQSFPVEISLWVGKPAAFSTPHTKSEEEEDGEQAAIITTQKERWREKQRGRSPESLFPMRNTSMQTTGPQILQHHNHMFKCPGICIHRRCCCRCPGDQPSKTTHKTSNNNECLHYAEGFVYVISFCLYSNIGKRE